MVEQCRVIPCSALLSFPFPPLLFPSLFQWPRMMLLATNPNRSSRPQVPASPAPSLWSLPQLSKTSGAMGEEQWGTARKRSDVSPPQTWPRSGGTGPPGWGSGSTPPVPAGSVGRSSGRTLASMGTQGHCSSPVPHSQWSGGRGHSVDNAGVRARCGAAPSPTT